jgi:hypothetical protein
MPFLKQSTAATVEVGPVLNVDGTPYVTDNLAYGDFLLCKAGTSGALNASATVAHQASDVQGMFLVTLTTTDTNTVGRLTLTLNKATLAAAPVYKSVLSAAVYDSMFGTAALLTAGTGTGQLNVTGGVAQADVAKISTDSGAADNLEAMLDGTGGLLSVQSAILSGHGDHTVFDLGDNIDATSTLGAAIDEITGEAYGYNPATMNMYAAWQVLSKFGFGGAGPYTVNATVPDGQKVDVNTLKTRAIADPGAITVYLGNATAAIAVNGSGYVTYANAAPPAASDVAALILATPAQKLVTDANGYVTFANTSIATVTNLTNLPAVPTDWLAASGVKADAVTKIQLGLATPTNITAGTITTVTNVTNLPSIPNNWLTAAGIAANALDSKGNWITSLSGIATATDVSTLATTLASAHGSGSWATATGFALATSLPTNFSSLVISNAGVVSASATVSLTEEQIAAIAAGIAGQLSDPWVIVLPGEYAPGTAGYLIGHSGGLAPKPGAYTDTIRIDAPGTTTPLEGVWVWVNTVNDAGADTGTTVWGKEATDGNGIVTAQLDAGTYWVHAAKPGYMFDTTWPKKLTVTAEGFTWA